MSPDKLIILSDGTCGSTCASFTRIAQEAGVATFVGAGGLWKEEMDVASFAGGFVCNPDYLTNMAEMSGLPSFPNFVTNQRWQFGWAAWYSQILPSRPVQFISMEPDYRSSFWSFPHVSVNASVTTAATSALYDSMIVSSFARIKEEENLCSSSGAVVWLSVATGTLGFGLLGVLSYVALDKGWIKLAGRESEGDGKNNLLG